MDLLARTIIILVFTYIVSGLGAYGYSLKRQQFESFGLITFWTILIITTFSVIYLRDIFQDISSGNFNINDVGKLYYYMNILVGIIAYLTNVYYVKREIIYMNLAKVRLYEILNFLDDGEIYRREVTKVAIKALIFPIFLLATLIVRALHFEPEKNLIWTIYSFIPYVIRATPATTFYGVMLLSKAIIQGINLRVQRIVNEVNRMHTHKEWRLTTPYHRMQRYCDLSDEIDVLNDKYSTVIELTDELQVFTSLPWLGSVLCNVLGIMLGLLTQYLTIAETLFNGKEYDYYNVLTDSSFMFISIMELYTQFGSCASKVQEVRRTGIILQKADTSEADIRLRESMDFFSLRVLQRNYKIKPLGLLEIDLSLIHGVFSTATGFLLILIQSDLSKRFLQ